MQLRAFATASVARNNDQWVRADLGQDLLALSIDWEIRTLSQFLKEIATTQPAPSLL